MVWGRQKAGRRLKAQGLRPDYGGLGMQLGGCTTGVLRSSGALAEPRLLLKERGYTEEALRAGPPGGGSGKPGSWEGLVGRVGFRTYRRKDRQVEGGASRRRVVRNPGVILL